MCSRCDSKIQISRRSFLGASIAGSLSLAFKNVLAADAFIPKQENVIKPDDALSRLIKGNERYVANNPSPANFAATRAALSKGQNPFACILSCADSRVSPELCFDAERGDLFVTRVAGNYVTPQILASLEYGTTVLQSPLIVVMGHTSCGAIKASIEAVQKDASFPGHIQTITTDLSPAVRSALQKRPANLEEAVTRENVLLNVEVLRNSTPILRKRVQSGQLKVVGGIYHLNSGSVEMMHI
jgi:carbonic anhydrase